MTWLISLVTGIGIPARFAKAALIALGCVLIALMAFAAIKLHDRRVVAAHEAGVAVATAKADRTADTHAADARIADQARAANDAAQIKEAIHEAGTDPNARRAAFYRCVRAQQAARRAGKLAAGC